MAMAMAAAARSTCPRLAVGAVAVDDEARVVGTGHNGAPAGSVHCTDAGCLMVDGHCVRTLHAEVNAVAQACRRPAMVYCTSAPCLACLKTMLAAGVKQVVYFDWYVDDARSKFTDGLELVGLPYIREVNCGDDEVAVLRALKEALGV